MTCRYHINHTSPSPCADAAECSADLCPLGSTRDESVLHRPVSVIRWHHQHGAGVNFSPRSQGERCPCSLNKSGRRVHQNCRTPNWLPITFQQRLWSTFLPLPHPAPPKACQLSLSVMPRLSPLLGNNYDGHQQKTGDWDGTIFLIRCPAGPKALLHVGQRQVPRSMFLPTQYT